MHHPAYRAATCVSRICGSYRLAEQVFSNCSGVYSPTVSPTVKAMPAPGDSGMALAVMGVRSKSDWNCRRGASCARELSARSVLMPEKTARAARITSVTWYAMLCSAAQEIWHLRVFSVMPLSCARTELFQ